jgi:hypothetical protein
MTLTVTKVDNKEGSAMCLVRWQIETPLGWVGAWSKRALDLLLAAQPTCEVPGAEPSFQQRVQPWLMECFGPTIAADRVERNHRFFEEATELVQATGMTVNEAHQLVDYVFNRPVGEPNQEVGGTMVTLAALCLANDLDMHSAGETELARISVPETVAKIRAKQAAKPKHSPLPEHVPRHYEEQPDGTVLPVDPAEVAQHPDDAAVDRFAAAMKEKLAQARAKGRGGWDTDECTQETLSRMLREHVEKGDPRDVANFCMFLWCRGEGILQVVTNHDLQAAEAIQSEVDARVHALRQINAEQKKLLDVMASYNSNKG